MDLEALPPEDPTPPAPAGLGAPGAPGGPDGPRGPEPAPPAWTPPPWQPAPPPWAPGPWGAGPASGPPGTGGPGGGPGGGDGGWGSGPGDLEPPAKQPRLPRSTKVVGAAVAVAMIAGGAWAAGTALHGSPSTVRFRAASAVGNASTGSGASGTSGTNGPHPARRYPGGGVSGSVTGVDSSTTSFTFSHRVRPATGTAPAAPATPGAAPAAPTTTTTKVVTNSSTTFYVTGPATPSDIVVGQEISAFGQSANGTLTATRVAIVDPGIIKLPNKPAPANPPANASPNVKAPANRPFEFGTVKSVTTGTNGSVTVVVTQLRGGDGTVVVPTSAKIVKTSKGSFGSVAVNDLAAVRGTKNADGSITASVVEVVSSSLAGQGAGGVRGFGPAIGPWVGFGPGPGFGAGPGFGRRGGFPGRWAPGQSGTRPGPASPPAGTGTNAAI